MVRFIGVFNSCFKPFIHAENNCYLSHLQAGGTVSMKKEIKAEYIR